MAQVEITTVKAQQQIKSLKDEIRVLFKHMQTLNREFNKQVAISAKLSNALAGKLTPVERRVAAVAKSAEAAFVRQAKATNTAREQTLNFAQALRSAGATQQQQKFILRGVVQSLAKYQKRMSSGVLTARQFQEAQARLNRTFGSAKRSLSSLSAVQKKQAASANGVAKSNKGLTTQLKNLGSSAIFAVGPLSGIGARINALGAIATRTGVRIAIFAAGIVALGVAIFKTIKNMVRVTVEVNKIRNALRVATGSTKAAEVEFRFLIATSRKLSLDISKVGGQFSKLAAAARGTSLAGQGVRDIFEAVSAASLVLGLSADQTAGALKAIEQIISKGTVQAEELRGQLGERLPGAFQIAARAMGVTTKALGKLLELGLVVSTEFLPKFAAELKKMIDPQVAKATEQLTATVNRLKTEMFLFFDVLEQKTGIVEKISGIIDTLGRGMQVINEALRGTEFPSERFGPPAPTNTFDQLRNLPIGPVDKFKVSLIAMRKVIKSLGDPNLSIKGKLGVVAEFERAEKVSKAVTKIIKKMDDEELKAFRTLFDGSLRSMERVRVVLGDLVNRFLDAKKAIDETTKSLEDQDKFLKAAEKRFFTTIVPRGEGITKARVGPDTGGSVRALNERQAFNQSVDETIEKLREANDVLRLRLKGLDEEADIMDIRNKLEREFGDQLVPKTREELEKLRKLNKELRDQVKDRNADQKEAARLAKDFSRVIGTAFEDAIIKGKGLREVLKGILDDIIRIILRVTVTKPLGGLLEGVIGTVLTGLAGGVSGPGPGAGPPIRLAHGGPLRAGQLPVVGEKGPEFFRPNTSGTIIPANMNAPSSIVVHQTFDFRGASLEAVALLRRESARIRRETIAEITRRRTRGVGAARR